MAKTCGEKLFFNTFVMIFAENAILADTIFTSPVISPCERSQACGEENDFGAKPWWWLRPEGERVRKRPCVLEQKGGLGINLECHLLDCSIVHLN